MDEQEIQKLRELLTEKVEDEKGCRLVLTDLLDALNGEHYEPGEDLIVDILFAAVVT